MTEHPSLETPGGLIRARRESLGISLPEMSERTKIPPPVLEAIERDEYHKVSGALYIKSFLRTCAVEVGLDADELLSLYGSFSGDLTPRSGGGETVWSEEEVQISHIGLPWRSIGLVGAVLVLAGLGALLLTRGCEDVGGQSGTAVQAPGESRPGLLAGAAETPAHESLLAKPGPASAAGPDTLAGAWASGRDSGQEEVTDAVPDKENADAKAIVVPKPLTADDAPAVAGETQVAANPDPTASKTPPLGMPLPLVGGPHLVFAGGQKKPVVLRIICDRPLGIQVKRDAEQTFAAATWPPAGAAVPALPPTGIEPGRVYGVSRGLVVYWGAEDHFSLRLDRTDGVEVALNGKVRNVRNLRPGGELLLDDHGD